MMKHLFFDLLRLMVLPITDFITLTIQLYDKNQSLLDSVIDPFSTPYTKVFVTKPIMTLQHQLDLHNAIVLIKEQVGGYLKLDNGKYIGLSFSGST